MRLAGSPPFRGYVVWLTPEQGGRSSGPPPTPIEHDYAATAYVLPRGPESLASFALRVEDRTAWRSPATGGWLIVDNTDPYTIRPGAIVAVTEGPSKVVAYFHVTEVTSSAPDQPSS
jgi:hypothetical protein